MNFQSSQVLLKVYYPKNTKESYARNLSAGFTATSFYSLEFPAIPYKLLPRNPLELPMNPLELPKNLLELLRNPLELPRNPLEFPLKNEMLVLFRSSKFQWHGNIWL